MNCGYSIKNIFKFELNTDPIFYLENVLFHFFKLVIFGQRCPQILSEALCEELKQTS